MSNQYCNKHGCDWTEKQHVKDEYMGELIIYECTRCGARQARWCNTWEKRGGTLSVPCYSRVPPIQSIRISLKYRERGERTNVRFPPEPHLSILYERLGKRFEKDLGVDVQGNG